MTPWLRKHAADYDAIIVNGLWNYSVFGASRILPEKNTPYFVFTHGMLDPWFRRTYPLKHAAKQLFWLIGEGRLLENAISVLFTTEDERRLAKNQFVGHTYQETVVGYGTSASPPLKASMTHAFGEAVPGLAGHPYLLFLSRIHEKKGCDILITAFAQAALHDSNLHLVMAGNGDPLLVRALKDLAQGLGLGDRIHWPGLIQGDVKWGALYGADAFILSSHQENFGVAVAEALACRKPVLISDKVNIWREVAEANAGLVQADTVEGTAAMISQWLEKSDADRTAMGIAGGALFSRSFDIANVGPALIRMIESRIYGPISAGNSPI
ncbi:hypothetical protein BH10PSE1_BH10PSE1_26070 [soil metagenome]